MWTVPRSSATINTEDRTPKIVKFFIVATSPHARFDTSFSRRTLRQATQSKHMIALLFLSNHNALLGNPTSARKSRESCGRAVSARAGLDAVTSGEPDQREKTSA